MRFQKLFHRINKNIQIFYILQMTFKNNKKCEKMHLRDDDVRKYVSKP